MNYVITGSLGHISKPIVKKLIEKGHQVTVISSSDKKTKEIESLGAKAAIGSVDDPNFIDKVFEGADMVYLMIPPKWDVIEWKEYLKKVADIYVHSIKKNQIKKAVQLSSAGAQMKHGVGPVDGLAYLEDQLKSIPDLDLLILRPSYFYYNIFSMMPLIKNMNIMGSAQPGSHNIYLTHTNDIAETAANEMLKADFKGKIVVHIFSDQCTWSEITDKVGKAIGKKELKWVEFSDEEALQGMLQSGLNKSIAKEYVEMGKALRSGEMEAEIKKDKETKIGKVKIDDFIKELAGAYKNS